jgi:hypothetical protein
MDNIGLNHLVPPEAIQQFQGVITQLLSHDNDLRGAAEQRYNETKGNYPDQLLVSLLHLAACAPELPVRIMCAVMFRQEVLIPTTEDAPWLWRTAAPETKAALKSAMITALQRDQQDEVRKKLTDALSALSVSALVLEDNSWPELLPFLLSLSENENPELRVAALDVFGYLLTRTPEALEGHFQNFIPFLQQKLADPSTKVRVASFFMIYGLLQSAMESDNGEEQLQKLQATAPGVLESVSACLHANDVDSARLGMEFLVEIVDLNVKYLRPNILNLIELMLKIAKSPQLDDPIRHLGVETMITLTENKPGMARKIPNFLPEIVGLLLEWNTHLEENEDWNKGEEDDLDDMDAAVAEESLDRVSIAMGGESIAPILFSAIPSYLGSDDWRKRHSGLTAISVSGEGSADYLSQHLNDVVPMVLPFFKDPHPRVRWAACNAIGQMCTDFQPNIQAVYCNDILSALVPVFDDAENPRVQSHAASAIVNFCEECSKELLSPYLKPILEKLHGLLRSPKIVQEQVVTAIAAIADVAMDEFLPFYDYFVPFLKDILNTANSKEFLRLRCKAMECVSIIGVAVGKERFMGDAQEIIGILNKINFASDPEMPSMHLAWARLCKCLGADFQPYLEIAMPLLLQLANTEPEVEIIDSEKVEEFDDEGWQVLPIGGKTMCIKTAPLEDKATAINIIFCFADELKEVFFPFVQPAAEIMVPSLTFAYHDAVRNTAASACPCLLTSTIEHLKKSGQSLDPVVTLWNYIQPQLLKAIRKEIDDEAHVAMLEAYSECFDLIGENSHNPQSLQVADATLHKILGKYLEARSNRGKIHGEGEEDFDEFEAQKLESQTAKDDDVIALIAELVGKLLKTYGKNYLPFFLTHVDAWKGLISPTARPRDCQIALCLFDDLTEHIQGDATPYVQELFPGYGHLCTSETPDVRQAAVFGAGLFAQHCGQAFGPLANSMANALCQVASDPQSRAPENVHATENAISSLGKICLYQGDSVNLGKFVAAFVSFLPVCEDKEESKVSYATLCTLLDKNPQMVLGADFAQLPHVLHVFGGILGSDLIDASGTEKVVASIKRLESANQKMFQEACGVLSDEEKEKVFRASNM